MKLLLLAHAFNGLTQRLHCALREAGHEVSVELDISDAVTEEAVALADPDLIVAPFLKRRIPESVWSVRPCLVVHPGPPGDRGPAALDWAVLRGDAAGGVTVLQATGDFDAGPVWAWRTFALHGGATKAACTARDDGNPAGKQLVHRDIAGIDGFILAIDEQPVEPDQFRGSSPANIVRCIKRPLSSGYGNARCMVPVLSQMSRSPTCHSWR